MVRAVLAFATALLLGCDPSAYRLVVDLRTDLGAPHEIDAARVRIDEGEPVEVSLAEIGADALAGGRQIFGRPGVPAGTHEVLVELLLRGDVVLARPVRVALDEDQVVTVVMTRDCRGVSCPGDGDSASAVACLRQMCVDPTCSVETPELCPASECDTASDCMPPDSCGAARCEAGVCLFTDDGSCGEGRFCDATVGCRDQGDLPEEGWRLASDADRIYLGGTWYGSIGIGSERLPITGAGNVLIQARDPAGTVLYSRPYLSDEGMELSAFDANGGVVALGGVTFGSEVFLPLVVPGEHGHTGFVASVDGATGDPVWVSRFVGGLYAGVDAVAIGADGSLYAAVRYQSDITIDGTLLEHTESSAGAIVAFDSTGSLRWALLVTGPGGYTYDLTVGPSGALFAAGLLEQTTDYGGTMVTGVGVDGYVARITDVGDSYGVDWVRTFGGAPNPTARAVVPDGIGGAYVLGWLSEEPPGSFVFGDASTPPAGGGDAFIGHVTGDGTLDDHALFGGAGRDRGYAMASAGGSLVLTGSARGPLTAGPFDIPGAPADPVAFRAVFDPVGTSSIDAVLPDLQGPSHGTSLAPIPGRADAVCVVGQAPGDYDEALIRGATRSIFLSCDP